MVSTLWVSPMAHNAEPPPTDLRTDDFRTALILHAPKQQRVAVHPHIAALHPDMIGSNAEGAVTISPWTGQLQNRILDHHIVVLQGTIDGENPPPLVFKWQFS